VRGAPVQFFGRVGLAFSANSLRTRLADHSAEVGQAGVTGYTVGAMMTHQQFEEGPAAFGCVHMVRDRVPILSVSRDPPADSRDSGWCFACGQGGHSSEDWMIISAQ
jgi:hypothetical protein